MSIGELAKLEFTSCMLEHKIKTKCNIRVSVCKIIISHIFSDFSHIGVDFRILICEFTYAWRPCGGENEILEWPHHAAEAKMTEQQ